MKVKKSLPLASPTQHARVLRGRVIKLSDSADKENIPRSSAKAPKHSPKEASTPSKRASTPSKRASTPSKRKLSRRDFSDLIEVGRGGFSVVYRAFLRPRQETCVLKFLDHSKTVELNVKREDIAKERSLFERLNHINIPKLLGFFRTATTSVFVMEYCDRGDIYDYIYPSSSKAQPFPRTVNRNVDYVRQLVIAVEYFQKSTKHIHMDVKPENILVTSKDIIKLTDFGCSLPMKSPRRVQKKDKGGTKQYQPPEQLRHKNKAFDSTVDVWGIGCVAFQMMAPFGEHPFFCRDSVTTGLSEDFRTAFKLMADFKNGICQVGEFDRMDEGYKTFLRQTIGADREQRPLVSKLLETPLLATMSRPRAISPCF